MVAMKLSEFTSFERGRKARLASDLNVPPQLIGQWSDGSRPIPSARCPSIELATAGAVTCEELLPHLTWHRILDAAWPHPLGRPVLDFCPPAPAIPAPAPTTQEVPHG